MIRRALGWIGVCASMLFLAPRCPAPLVYTPGEGWHYEVVGGEKWQRPRAKDQLEVAQTAFDAKNYTLAHRAARRTVNVWPYSDYAPQAQYFLGRSLEAQGQDEKAFKAYQALLERYPKIDNYDEVVTRQFVIADRFLAGQWFLLWGYIPAFPSMEKTIKLYEQIIKNGPYSEVAPYAQMNIAKAHENKFVKDYPEAARAYERAADRYSDRKTGVDAMFNVGVAYHKQAKTAEYDQSIAAQAIATFTDFMTLHPDDPRVSEAQKYIDSLKSEQARGSYDIARFYERKKRWQGALVYYNDVVQKDPASTYADEARKRIEAIKKRIEG